MDHRLDNDSELFPVQEMRGPIHSIDVLVAQITAGNSVLTFRSHRSGERLTLRFKRPKEEPGRRRPIWVSVLSGPDNESTYTFLGTIWPNPDGSYTYRHSLKSPFTSTAPSAQLAGWLAYQIGHKPGLIFEGADIWHEGRCGRCGRRLTVPESIEHGFGPECIKHITF